MLSYARSVFQQQVQVGTSGSNVGAHLRQAAKSLKLSVDHFAPKGVIPQGLEFVWEAFLDLASARWTTLGYLPIPFSEILAWSELHQAPFARWQVSVIRRLDHAWLEIMNSSLKKDEKK